MNSVKQYMNSAKQCVNSEPMWGYCSHAEKEKKKKKAENVDAAKRQETRKPNTHIEFSIEAGFSELVIEGDNVNVMVAVSCSSVNHSLLGHIFEDVHYYLRGLQFASISLIRGGGWSGVEGIR